MDTEFIFVCSILLLASFVRGASGFAFGLLSMSLLPDILGFRDTAALIAVLKLLSGLILLLYYRKKLKFEAISRFALVSTLTIPIGFILVERLNKTLLLETLGIVIMGYALYALFLPQLPKVERSPALVDTASSVSGILGGAYNIGGPPLVIYASLRQWGKDEFKANVQPLFLINGFFITLSHGFNHGLTRHVWQIFLVTLPVFCIGLAAGIFASSFMDEEKFKNAVLVLLLFLGLKVFLTPLVQFF